MSGPVPGFELTTENLLGPFLGNLEDDRVVLLADGRIAAETELVEELLDRRGLRHWRVEEPGEPGAWRRVLECRICGELELEEDDVGNATYRCDPAKHGPHYERLERRGLER